MGLIRHWIRLLQWLLDFTCRKTKHDWVCYAEGMLETGKDALLCACSNCGSLITVEKAAPHKPIDKKKVYFN